MASTSGSLFVLLCDTPALAPAAGSCRLGFGLLLPEGEPLGENAAAVLPCLDLHLSLPLSPSLCVCALWSTSIYFMKEFRSLEVAKVKVSL